MVSIILNQSPVISATTFVDSTTMTVAQLHTNYPPTVSTLGLYARVSDLYGAVDDIMRCRWDGVAYKWVPQRPNFTGTSTATGGNVSILPLITPPTLRMTGSLLSNMTITPSATLAFIGQKQTIVQEGALNLVTSTITGLIGSNLTLLGSNARVIEYGPTGWFASA